MRTFRTFVIHTFKLAIAVVFILGSLTVQAKAQHYGVNGLLMGAGSGALVGQAIGRDTEATLIGAAVGGMLGYMTGNDMDTEVYAGGYGLAQPVTFYPSVPRHVFPHRQGRICRDFVVVERHYGHFREVVKTVCRDRHLKHFRGDNRHHFFNDHRKYFRGDHRKHFRGDHHYQFRGDHRKHFRGGSKHHWKGGSRHHWKGGHRHNRW